MKLLFIGAGKMATALGKAIVAGGILPKENIVAADILEAARLSFSNVTGIRTVSDAAPEVASADVIILAVKPQVAANVVASLPKAGQGTLVLSICAGIPLAKLCNWFGSERVIRVMPNTPLMVGQGASAFALGAAVTQEDAEFAKRLLSSAGKAWQVPEEMLDAVTALSGSGPAYIFAMAEAMTEAGVAAGLPQELSMELTLQTITGSAEMMSRRIDTPEHLRQAVTSPNGTTYAALQVMQAAGFTKTMVDAIIAAKKRSQELGK
jgi:pyrroline-5-carboxylate reductase